MTELEEQLAVREAWESPQGRVLQRESLKFLVQLAKQTGVQAEWLRGIGLLMAHLDDTRERLERLKERR